MHPCRARLSLQGLRAQPSAAGLAGRGATWQRPLAAVLQNWRLCLEMVHLANFSDRQYVCQLWDLALKEVGRRRRGVEGAIQHGWVASPCTWCRARTIARGVLQLRSASPRRRHLAGHLHREEGARAPQAACPPRRRGPQTPHGSLSVCVRIASPPPLQAWQQQWEAGGEAAAAVGAGDDDAAAAALDECCQLAESLGERFYPNEGRWAGPAP